MTTFTEMSQLASIKDFTADTVRGLIGEFRLRGKVVDLEKEDPMKLINRVDWIVNRVGRALDVSGKLDPATTSFKLDRDADNLLHVRFVDADENTLYTLDLGEKGAEEFQYIVTDAEGNEVVRDHKWKAVAAFFAPEKEVEETPVKAAARPKKAKKEKVVKSVKAPVPAQPAETDVLAEVDDILTDEVPSADL